MFKVFNMNSKSFKGARTTLRRNAVAQACVTFAMLMATGSQLAVAGPGFVDAVEPDGVTGFRKSTFFAYSPSGERDTPIPEADGANYTGKALRKFIDPLPLPRAADATGAAPTLAYDTSAEKYIPVAKATKWVNPQGIETQHDYYEIAIVEYAEKFHSDLRKATTLRGYVQIDHQASNGRPALPGSKSFALNYPNGGGPIMINGTDANGKLTGAKVAALAVDKPHFLGPVIAATKDIPTRVKVLNLLPVGRAVAESDGNGGFIVSARNGDLFLPVDKSIVGAGLGPDGITEYTQNRASVHLHGGDTPWISDGTPHQWITPAGENDANNPLSLAAAFNDINGFLDASMLPNYTKGVSTQNVPDMNDPGDGAMTLYYPNGQSARMLWYHDHTFGATRLNVYAGMASAYLVTDDVETALINSGTIGTGLDAVEVPAVLPPAERTIPLVLQDRTFVPDDIALQDARWNTSAWGEPGDSWFPHVYETVQDPDQANNWNAVGRWHYGPWFWPVFPALYTLPEGTYSPAGFENTVTTTPEAWNDTPIINGVAYPTLEVDPTTYRFRILNASNDRLMTFNLFVASDTAKLSDGTLLPNTVTDKDGNVIKSELEMIPAAAVLGADACAAGQLRTSEIIDANGPTGRFCIPETWPTDGRLGGVPAPAQAGPAIHQIASEGGWLPKVASYEPTPINYITDKGRIVVLNVDYGKSGLFIAAAERADVVIDFSQYAGKTLLVYNDSGAPVPAGDPRNDLHTGVGDQSSAGGAEDTKPGYGPNTRTMMQIKVKDVAPAAAMDPIALDDAIQAAYYSDPDRRPIVAQSGYSGFDGSWDALTHPQMYGDIYLGSLKNPVFNFTPGTKSDGIASVVLSNQGSGYTVAPLVDIPAPADGTQATGVATMKLEKIDIINPGKGYTTAPLVRFAGGGGNGATAGSYLRVDDTPGGFSIVAEGNYPGYTGNLQASFTPAPRATPNSPAGVRATGYAVVVAGKVKGLVVTNPGSGYTAIPLVSILNRKTDVNGVPIAGANGVQAGSGGRVKVTGMVDSVLLFGTDNSTPAKTEATKGGGGYTDLRTLQINLRTGLPTDALGQPIGTVATAIATGKVFDVTLTHSGTGYTTPVTPSFTQVIDGVPVAPVADAVAATTVAAEGGTTSHLVKTKAIQELFDPTYGRINATLGVELPFTSALTQTTIPLGYVDETTEKFADGETQIWKITHNGVDSHPVHFHLLNVQLINRVGWDGFIQPPEPREMGWKETVTMSPLEDVIVAVRAKKPPMPGFGVPVSNRLMDPTQPEGSPFGFTQIDPVTGTPKVVTNTYADFGWEYVWHCHILGHEENDFMRPINFVANELLPGAPTLAVPVVSADGTSATLSYADNADTEFKFSVQRAPVATDQTVGAFAEISSELALTAPSVTGSFVDTSLAASQAYAYKVVAVGAAGSAESAPQTISTYAVPTAPVVSAAPNSATEISLSWTIAATTALTGYTIVRTNPDLSTANFTADAAATGFTDSGLVGNSTYSYVVTAVNGDKTAASTSVSATTMDNALAAPGALTYNANGTRIMLSWTDQSTTEQRFRIERSTDGGATWTFIANKNTTNTGTSGVTNVYSNTVGNNATQVKAGNTYTYRVIAERGTGASLTQSLPSASITVAFVAPGAPEAPVAASVTRAGSRDSVVLNWTAAPAVADQVPVTSSRIEWSRFASFTTALGAASVAGFSNVNNSSSSATVLVGRGAGGVPNPAAYFFRVRTTNAAGNSAYSAASASVATQ